MKGGTVTLIIVTEPGDDELVTRHYPPLYRFALSLTQREAEALDLVQQTYYLWAAKGHQLRDAAKLKSWFFTTLYREYLAARRRENRFPHITLEVVEPEPAAAPSDAVDAPDADAVMRALSRMDEVFRAPLALFYLENLSYKQIAEMLGVPPGTVMSRLSRGREQLRRLLGREFHLDSSHNLSPVVVRPRGAS
jgi:RNA polymerase sigma-70 factor (ECF subfamily)